MKLKVIILLLTASLIAIQAFRVSRDAGLGLSIESIPFGQCVAVSGPVGPGDLYIDQQHAVAFISADDRRSVSEHRQLGLNGSPGNGDIWLLDLLQGDSEARPLKVQAGPNFHPHGIDLITLEDGRRELYVINHVAEDNHEVIIFNVADDHTLSMKRRISYPAMISPNDLVALGDDRFFATNDHGSPSSSLMHTIEEYLGLSRSSVSYFDGKQGEILLRGIKSANGIEISEDQQTLYVAEAIGRSVRRYERNGGIESWKLVNQLLAGSAVDNLIWRDDGTLLAGAHPKLFDFLAHSKNEDSNSPSEVISIDVSGNKMSKKSIYMNNGSQISGSSVAAMFKDEMLIGAVFEEYLMRCRQNSN